MSEPRVIQAYAAGSAGAKLTPFQYSPDELGPYDIEIAISHCGICYSDIHMIDNDWQNSEYPLITGRRRVCGSPCGSRHEIREMLSLAARAGVHTYTEVFPLERVNEALDRVRSNLARYRIVLEMES